MDSQKAQPGIQTGVQASIQRAEIERRSVAVDAPTDSPRAEMGSQSEEASAQPFSHAGAGPINAAVTAAVNAPIDAWPEQGISIWPDHTRHAPLLPPLPVQDQRPTLGWILEWPAGWLRDTPLRHISLAPLRRISLRPRTQTQPRTQPRTPTRPDLTRQRSPTRPDLQARLMRTSIPISQYKLTQRPYPSRVSVPMAPPRRSRHRWVYVVITLLLLLTLAGAGVLVTEPSTFGLDVPLDPLRTLISGGESTAPSNNPSVIRPPALGSEAGAFAARFGASAPTAIGDATAQYNTRIAGQSVALRVEFGMGVDRFEHVVTINATDPTLQGWEAATADTICMTFMPSDAQLHTFSHVAGQTEYIYISASLAALFSSASFANDNGDLVAPGTFNRLDQPALGIANGVRACTLALGQHTFK